MARQFLTPIALPGDPTAPLQATTKQYVDARSVVTSVATYGATGNGTTDDTTAIQAAIAACPAGGHVWFPPGLYVTSSPLVIPPNVTVEGSHGDTIWYTGASAIPCAIMPSSSFSGAAVVQLLGKGDTSPAGSVDHVGARLRNLTIDGTNLPSGNVRGLMIAGLVREATVEWVTVRKTTGAGFWLGAGPTSGLFPASLRLRFCLADTCGNNGYTISNVADSTIIDCNALGNTNAGFNIAGFMNGQVANCRSEWSTQQGIYVTSGYWGTGQGSGGCNFLACSTDRSGYNGIYVDATGAGALQFTNCFHRRDGRNGGTGGGGYAGFFVSSSATMPVVLDNIQVYPGVDDNGSGTNSPQIGFSSTGSNLATVNSGYIFAATTALATGTGCVIDGSVGTATGTGASPTRVAPVGDVPVTRQILPGTGLTGGGALSADRTLTVAYGTTSSTAAVGNDARLSDTRTPTDATVTDAKVASGAAIAESKLSLASDAVAATASRRTLGTGAQQAAAGNDTRLSDTRTPTDGTVTDAKVSSSAAIAESKLSLASDAAAGTASRRTLGTGSTQAAAGNDSRITGAAPTASPTFTGTVTTARTVRAPVVVTFAATQTIDGTLGNHFRITMTANMTSLALPTGLIDGQDVLLELIQDATGGRTLAGIASGWNVTTALTGALTLTTTASTRSYIGGKYRSSGTKIDVLAFGTGIAA